MDGNKVDSSEMLKELRIDRSQPPPSSGGTGKIVAIVLVVVVLAAAGGWALFGRAAPIAVKTATAQSVGVGSGGGAASVLDATGYVTARRQATVSAKITGKVQEVLIEEGRRVEVGDVMARLDDVELKASVGLAQAQVEAARAALADLRVRAANATREAGRQQEMMTRKLTSDQSLDTARTTAESLKAQIAAQERQIDVAQEGLRMARVNLDNAVIRAPFAGVIIAKAAQPGEIVSPMSAGGGFTRTGIGTIVDMDSLEIEVDVNEAYIGRVQPGQPIESTLNAYPDWKLPGKVIAIIPTADRSKATVKVRISIDTKDARIVPDMGARVAFMGAANPAEKAKPLPGVLVPTEAIRDAAGGALVYVVKEGKAQERKVDLGGVFGTQRQVLSGVTLGERVVLAPPPTLLDGARVDAGTP